MEKMVRKLHVGNVYKKCYGQLVRTGEQKCYGTNTWIFTIMLYVQDNGMKCKK